MEHLDTATATANWFEAFIKHASVMSIVLALLGSWFATGFFKIPIRWMARRERQTFYIRGLDIAIAFGICAWTWPNDWRFVWAFVVGFGSPWIYWPVAALVCRFVPSLKPVLSLRELAGDDPNIPSGESP
jgi:hypothetical protein